MSKFLSYEDRMIIAQRLQENASFGAIGKELGKDRTTIAKEIKKYSYDKKSGRPGYPYNPCKFRATCKAKRICGTSCTHQSICYLYYITLQANWQSILVKVHQIPCIRRFLDEQTL